LDVALTTNAPAWAIVLGRRRADARRPRIRWDRVLIYFFLSAGLVLVSFPFVWMVLTSFKSYTETTQLPPGVFPSVWHFENYAIAWQSAPFGRYLINSTVVAGCVVLGVLVSSILAAYAFAHMDFLGRNTISLKRKIARAVSIKISRDRCKLSWAAIRLP